MRFRVSGLLLSFFCGSSFAAAGDPDSSFLQGQPLLLNTVGITSADHLTVADDGSFSVSGHCGEAYCLAHFLVNGQLDSSFGDNGIVRMAPTATGALLAAFEYQEEGEQDADDDGDSDDDNDADDVISHHLRLLALDPNHPNRLLLARYTSAGQLDTDFDVSADADNDDDDSDTVDEDADDDGVIDENYDEDGIAELVLAGDNIQYQAATLHSNGKIAIGGSALLHSGDSHRKLWISRINADGILDASFYGSGKLFLTLTAGGETYTPVLDDIQIDSDATIVVSGHSIDLTHNVGFVLRLNSTGNLDSDFDGDGIRVLYPDNGSINAVHFDLDRNHRVAIVADYVDANGSAYTQRQWLDENGHDDADFNGSGSAILQPASYALSGQQVAWQYDGASLVAGQTADQHWVLSRFDEDGAVAQSGADVWGHESEDTIRQLAISRAGRFLVLGEQTLQVYTGDRLTPAAWALGSQNDVERGELVIADPVAISGLDRATLVTVEEGTVASNDEQDCDDTLTRNTNLVIANGEFLCVYVHSSSEYDESVTATVRIGADVAGFTATTEEDDSSSGLGGGSMPWSLLICGILAVAMRFKWQLRTATRRYD